MKQFQTWLSSYIQFYVIQEALIIVVSLNLVSGWYDQICPMG